jgi:general secretion pathway protein I
MQNAKCKMKHDRNAFAFCILHFFHRKRPRHTVRSGLTLLEMVLALALFVGAITVLAQVAWNGQRAAVQAKLRTEAAFRCETVMAEVLAGAVPFQSQQGIPFSDDPKWSWGVQIAPGKYPELLHVTVDVEHRSATRTANAGFSLQRWTRDPTLFLAAAAAQSASSTKSSTTTAPGSTSSAGSSGSSSSSQSGGSK